MSENKIQMLMDEIASLKATNDAWVNTVKVERDRIRVLEQEIESLKTDNKNWREASLRAQSIVNAIRNHSGESPQEAWESLEDCLRPKSPLRG